jgi:transcriptional regulator with XRE-family HTH domain
MTDLAANPFLQCGVPKAASKRRVPRATTEEFGDRLRRFRKAKGMTQTELGDLVGISQRLVTYYETQGGNPPADVLARLSEALDVSTDVLLGLAAPNDPRASAAPETLRLWRRLRRIEDVRPQDQKTILKMIDALADRKAK